MAGARQGWDTRSFDAWLADTARSRDTGGGAWFWRVHDAGEVLRRWGTAVPDNLHVLTLPRRDSAPGELWSRFASILGISPEGMDVDVRANASLGVEGAELLRRVNEALPDDFPEWHRVPLSREVLAHQVLAPRPAKTRINIPDHAKGWVRDYSEQLAAAVKDSGCHLVGCQRPWDPPQ